VPMRRQIGEKLGDLLFAQLARVSMEKNEPADPIQVRFFRAQAVSARPHEDAQLVEQFRLARKAGLGLRHTRGDQAVRKQP
jgi:hypothetical protein